MLNPLLINYEETKMSECVFFCKVLYLRLAGIEFQSLGLAMWKALLPYMYK